MSHADKPFSAASERNCEPILVVLREHFSDRRSVLEIGSGTGQHAVHFAATLPQLIWQTSDREENHAGILLWLADAGLPNVQAPLTLDVSGAWPVQRYDAIYSANTLHIMSWLEVEQMFARLPQVLSDDAKLVIYGPFNYGGRFTSDSNANFDASLRAAVPHRGIRDFEAVDILAQAAGLQLVEDRAMPANNRCLVWQRAIAAK
ncbi:MAG: DUF938 domain-containing protein [Pseudomonadota bacterium]